MDQQAFLPSPPPPQQGVPPGTLLFSLRTWSVWGEGGRSRCFPAGGPEAGPQGCRGRARDGARHGPERRGWRRAVGLRGGERREERGEGGRGGAGRA